MKVFLICLTVVAVAATEHTRTVTKLSKENGRLGMYKGQTTTINKHPYVASLLVSGLQNCAVTILNKKWGLVTGDCVYSLKTSQVTVVSGSNDGVTGTKHSVKQIVIHPEYQQGAFDNNIAMIQISDTFKFNKKTKAIKLPSKEIADNTQVVVVGYGSSDSVDGANDKLQQGQLKWLSKSSCNSLYKSYGITFSDDLACAYNKGKTTLCTGDWSDALVKNGQVYGLFLGGLSTGFCTSTASAGIFTDVYPFNSWIKNVTGLSY